MDKKRISLPKKKENMNEAAQSKISVFLSKAPSEQSKKILKTNNHVNDILEESNSRKKRKNSMETEYIELSNSNLKLQKTTVNSTKHVITDTVDFFCEDDKIKTKVNNVSVTSISDEQVDLDGFFEDIDFTVDSSLIVSSKRQNAQEIKSGLNKDKSDCTFNSDKTSMTSEHKDIIKKSPNQKNVQELQKPLKSIAFNDSLIRNNIQECNTNHITNGLLNKKDKNVNSASITEKDDHYIRKDMSNIVHNFEENIVHDDDMNFFFKDDWCNNGCTEIDLSSYTRCEIVDIDICLHETLLTIQDINSQVVATVKCRDFWRQIQFEKNQIAVIKAEHKSGDWVIDNNSGLFISYPDTLLSGTSVVGGLFCQRRTIIREIFHGLDTLPHYEPDALVMIAGRLTHEIMQEALECKIYTLKGITEIYEKKLQSREVINMLYSNNIVENDLRPILQPYVKHIFDFIEYYVKEKRKLPSDKKLKCKIEEIKDIEENIWLPKLGLKGKIDLTAEVNIHSRRKIMPIEIKTGRTTFSPEHKGQLILYTMMMKLTGRDVDSGLLLYIKDNEMKEIKGSHNEFRDLMLLRNNLAYYLTRKLKCSEKENGNKDFDSLLDLPEPINHPSCNKCSVKTLCCMYTSRDKCTILSDNHVLKSISNDVLKHLTSDHINYVLKWISLLQLEEAANTADFPQSNIWTIKPEKREQRRTCISNLKVIGKVVKESDKFIHVFIRRDPNTNLKFTLSDFVEQEYVIVSTDERVNISSGFIDEINSDTVRIRLQRNILALYPYATFHIDKNSSSNLIAFNNYGNLGGLLDNNDNCARLRDIIIDRKPATFMKVIPKSIMTKGVDIMKSLNDYQKNAVVKAVTSNNFMLIKGMPGTGKTNTLVVLIELLVKLGNSVLITAHTNTAVDNVLLRLLNRNIDFLRVGNDAKIHQSLKHKTENFITAHCSTPESLNEVYCSKQVVGMTCYAAGHPLCSKRFFDVCIVDESTQVMQPTVLRPLYSAAKFILVGDPKQLPPIARSKTARKLGMQVSLFEQLDNDNNSVTLKLQYRMNSRIMDVANKLTYNNKMIAANETVANATLRLKNYSTIESCEKWVQCALSLKLDDAAIMLNTKATYSMGTDIDLNMGTLNINVFEIAIIFRLIEVLLKSGMSAENIGVIAPYVAQVSRLREILNSNVEINTVDQYQGRDKEVIFYSCTKSTDVSLTIKEFDILQDEQRLSVAVTRAKHKLIVVGDKHCLNRFTPFNKLFASMKDEHVITLEDGHQDFSWKELMKAIHI